MQKAKILSTKNVYGKVATKRHEYKNGFGIQYHDTEVFNQQRNTITLNTGGWKTATTKTRINTYLPSGFDLYQRAHVWYIDTPILKKFPFFDGIKINFKGEVLNGKTKLKSLETIKAKNKKTLKQIKEYCLKVESKLQDAPLFPNGGDCWACSMFERGGQKDNDHLKQHIKEGYVMGSLNLNALKEVGYAHPEFILQSNMVESISRAVAKYLKKRLLEGV